MSIVVSRTNRRLGHSSLTFFAVLLFFPPLCVVLLTMQSESSLPSSRRRIWLYPSRPVSECAKQRVRRAAWSRDWEAWLSIPSYGREKSCFTSEGGTSRCAFLDTGRKVMKR